MQNLSIVSDHTMTTVGDGSNITTNPHDEYAFIDVVSLRYKHTNWSNMLIHHLEFKDVKTIPVQQRCFSELLLGHENKFVCDPVMRHSIPMQCHMLTHSCLVRPPSVKDSTYSNL